MLIEVGVFFEEKDRVYQKYIKNNSITISCIKFLSKNILAIKKGMAHPCDLFCNRDYNYVSSYWNYANSYVIHI